MDFDFLHYTLMALGVYLVVVLRITENRCMELQARNAKLWIGIRGLADGTWYLHDTPDTLSLRRKVGPSGVKAVEVQR